MSHMHIILNPTFSKENDPRFVTTMFTSQLGKSAMKTVHLDNELIASLPDIF